MSGQIAPVKNIEVFEAWSHSYNESIITLMQQKFGVDYEWFIRKVASITTPNSGDKILDVATGPGTVALALSNYAKNSCQITGIDISESMLNCARKNVSKVGLEENFEFRLANAEELPFESNMFDITTSSLIIHHTKVMQVLKEMIRVLKPGGRITVADVTANDNWRNSEKGLIFQGMDQLYMLGTESYDLPSEFHTFSEWNEMVEALHLVDVEKVEISPKHQWSRGIVIISGRKPLQEGGTN